MNLELKAEVLEELSGSRLDRFLKFSFGDEVSRATIQKWIECGYVRDQDQKILDKNSWKVKAGDRYFLSIPPRPPLNLEPIPMVLPVVLERENYLIIHKPPGIASHSGPGDRSPSLVNGLLHHFKELSKIGGETRPGIVHRLDKPTEGLMLIAKNDRAHGKLSELFRKREIEKKILRLGSRTSSRGNRYDRSSDCEASGRKTKDDRFSQRKEIGNALQSSKIHQLSFRKKIQLCRSGFGNGKNSSNQNSFSKSKVSGCGGFIVF